tara:strand:+ start:1849 stop:3429 length:1581 start_codon:yes stop_codon:yes gene_type:complete
MFQTQSYFVQYFHAGDVHKRRSSRIGFIMSKTVQHTKFPLACVILLFLNGTISILRAESPAVDPIVWKGPATSPEFRFILDDDEYQKRFDAAWKEIGSLGILEASNTPFGGQKILNVSPGSPAESLGIRPGDVFTHFDGNIMWTEVAFESDADEGREIRIVTSQGIERTLQVPSGIIGIVRTSIWHPEMEYLRSKHRSPQWDQDVVIGLMMASRDPELAETCWARALAAGYIPDHRSAIFGAFIALYSGRPEVAADFAYPLREIEVDEAVHPMILCQVALANYKLHDALRLTERMTTVFSTEQVEELENLIAMHEKRSLEKRCVPPPSQRAELMYRDDIRDQVVASDEDKRSNFNVERLRKSPQFNLDPPTNYYDPLRFRPKLSGENYDCQILCRIKEPTQTSTRFTDRVSLSFFDLNFWENFDLYDHSSSCFLNAKVYFNGELVASVGDPYRSSPPIERKPSVLNRELRIRLVKVDGQGEIYIDGRRLLYVPVSDDIDNIGIYFASFGLNVDVLDFRIEELIERL